MLGDLLQVLQAQVLSPCGRDLVHEELVSWGRANVSRNGDVTLECETQTWHDKHLDVAEFLRISAHSNEAVECHSSSVARHCTERAPTSWREGHSARVSAGGSDLQLY